MADDHVQQHFTGGTADDEVRDWAKQVSMKKIEPVLPLGFRLRGVDPRYPYLGARGIREATAAEWPPG
jgi:hypothetical protein